MAENTSKWGKAKASRTGSEGRSTGLATEKNLAKWAGYARSNAQSITKSSVGPDGAKAATLSKGGYTAGSESGLGRLQKTKRAK